MPSSVAGDGADRILMLRRHQIVEEVFESASAASVSTARCQSSQLLMTRLILAPRHATKL